MPSFLLKVLSVSIQLGSFTPFSAAICSWCSMASRTTKLRNFCGEVRFEMRSLRKLREGARSALFARRVGRRRSMLLALQQAHGLGAANRSATWTERRRCSSIDGVLGAASMPIDSFVHRPAHFFFGRPGRPPAEAGSFSRLGSPGNPPPGRPASRRQSLAEPSRLCLLLQGLELLDPSSKVGQAIHSAQSASQSAEAHLLCHAAHKTAHQAAAPALPPWLSSCRPSRRCILTQLVHLRGVRAGAGGDPLLATVLENVRIGALGLGHRTEMAIWRANVCRRPAAAIWSLHLPCPASCR